MEIIKKYIKIYNNLKTGVYTVNTVYGGGKNDDKK